MGKSILPSPETLRELLRYEPETGKLYWKARPREMFSSAGQAKRWNTRYAGKEAFSTLNGNDYFRGHLLGRVYFAHKVAWAIYYGKWSNLEIDHINRDPLDNRIINLREATKSQNATNRGIRKDNKSGFKGVYFHRATKKWTSRIVKSTNGGQRSLGYFDTPEAAYEAYVEAAKKHHREFANYG